MLIPCDECMREISHTAESCPYCGYKIPPELRESIDKEIRERVEARKRSEESDKRFNIGCWVLTVLAGILLLIFLHHLGS